MCNNMETEISRLVREIKKNEKELESAMTYKLMDQIPIYEKMIDRKIKLLEILKK